MLNHCITKMTGPLETWIIHLRFLCFYIVIQGVYSLLYCQNPYSHIKCLLTKIQSNIAIWQYIAIHSNTIRNMALTHIVSPLIGTNNYVKCTYSYTALWMINDCTQWIISNCRSYIQKSKKWFYHSVIHVASYVANN